MKRLRSFSHILRFETFLSRHNVDPNVLRGQIHPLNRPNLDSILDLLVVYNDLELRPADSSVAYQTWILNVFRDRKDTVLARPSFEQGAPQTLSATILQDPVWTVIDQALGRQIMQFLVYDACLLLPQPNDSFIQLTGRQLPYTPPAPKKHELPPATTQPFLTKMRPLTEKQKLAAKRGEKIRQEPPMDPESFIDPQYIVPLLFGHEFPPSREYTPLSDVDTPLCLFPLCFIVQQVKKNLATPQLAKKFRKIGGRKTNTVPKPQVAAFCTGALRFLFPPETFGSESNWKLLSEKISCYVKSGRSTRLYLPAMTQGFKITETWIGKASSRQQAQKNQLIFKQFMYWVFGFVNEYLLSHFVLRATGTGSDVYLKVNGWRQALREQRQVFTSTLVPIKNPTMSQKSLAANTYMVPKTKPGSFRTIVNLKRHKSMLAGANQVLGYHANMAHELPHIRSPREAYPLVHKYLGENPGSKFYAVRTDIQGCFDEANADTVLWLVNSLVSSSSMYTKRALVPLYSSWEKPTDAVTPISQHITPFTTTLVRSSHQVYIEQSSKTCLVTGQHVRTKVENVLNKLLVRVGDDVYYKTTGIPQGSTISTSLCNILCNDFIRTELSRIWSLPHALCLRYVDDFLFITTSPKDAKLFLKIINRRGGFPHHGISFSLEKTETNFGDSCAEDTMFLGIPISMRSNKITMVPTLGLEPLINAIAHGSRTVTASQRIDRCLTPVCIDRVPLDLIPYLKSKHRGFGECAWVDIEGFIHQKTQKLGIIFRAFKTQAPPVQLVRRVIRQSVRAISRLLLSLEVNFNTSRKIITRFLYSLIRSGNIRIKGMLEYGVGIWVSLFKRHNQRASTIVAAPI